MQALLLSTGIVALAEIGDKTQLLALLLAARYKKPVPIVLGILVATILNHWFAAAVGQWLTGLVSPEVMRWILGASFMAMAAWMLVPDKLDDDTRLFDRLGVFGATFLAFFLAEMGDKTQIATVALSARFDSLLAVVTGTTLGMLLANIPAVLLGEAAARALPKHIVHRIAAAIFALVGVATLVAF
ncbi:TMEM165/GDT1 family protein [Gulbenkiania mobilis]|uniref:TMEM165/GDT1 family protein n=1 Tax=Gulbenkiania mobilis TaxID=397457 RepID=UPI0006BBB0D1|nr:TMEM165/GDT1 family protein [Gulbenkiania mobilis]